MKKIIAFSMICGLATAASAAPYPVADPAGYDPYASAAIERADYAVAEERLERRLDENGGDVSALLNLASIMMATDRAARASSIYERVLDAENVLLETPDGDAVWSHQAAAQSLGGRVRVGAR